jgi:hypothetical protein
MDYNTGSMCYKKTRHVCYKNNKSDKSRFGTEIPDTVIASTPEEIIYDSYDIFIGIMFNCLLCGARQCWGIVCRKCEKLENKIGELK